MKNYPSTALVISLALSLSVVTIATSCSSKPTDAQVAAPGVKKQNTPSIAIETQQVAAEQKAEFVTEIGFAKKKVQLSESNRQALHKLITDASKAGQLEEIKVITWADSEYPSADTKILSSEQRALAKERNNAIKMYIDGHKMDVKVTTYSMAERAGALKEFVGSSEARIKKSLESAGIPTTDTTVKYPSKASKSIVMVVVK